MMKWTFLNDHFLPEENAVVHFKDLAVQRGYGIFDFFKFIDLQPVFLEDHLNRFFASASEMRLEISYSRQQLKNIIESLIKKNNLPDGGIRLTLTGGYSHDGFELSQPNLIISQHNFQRPTKELFDKGLKLITHAHQRQLPHIKTIDYLMAIWLQPVLQRHKADDVLYHHEGKISECPRSNFFIVTKNDRIITPAENILKGINRMKIIEVAKDHFELEEKTLMLEDIRNAKEAFISSTTKLILPVTCVNDQVINGPKSVSSKLYSLLSQLQTKEVEAQ